MRGFYRPENGPQIFAGPKGGYRKAWPEKFAEEPKDGTPSWREVVGGKLITSHVMMRHSYAVAMLSGTWGYDPQSLLFLQNQMGHADSATTERYYGKHEDGTWQRQVRHFTGRQARPGKSEGLTAVELLGLGAAEIAEAQSEARPPKNLGKTPQKYLSPSLTQIGTNPERNAPTEAHVLQALGGLAIEVLQAVEAGDPLAHTKSVGLARAVLAHLAERDGLLADAAAEVAS